MAKLENKPIIKTRYICPKCGEIVRITYFYPGMRSCVLTCNHIVKVKDCKEVR
jgi:hypothetical protein